MRELIRFILRSFFLKAQKNPALLTHVFFFFFFFLTGIISTSPPQAFVPTPLNEAQLLGDGGRRPRHTATITTAEDDFVVEKGAGEGFVRGRMVYTFPYEKEWSEEEGLCCCWSGGSFDEFLFFAIATNN